MAGIGFGYILPNGEAGDPGLPSPPSGATVNTQAQAAIPPTTAAPRTRTSVPEACLEATEWSDEVVALLNRKIRNDRLVQALREYTLARQACRSGSGSLVKLPERRSVDLPGDGLSGPAASNASG